MTISKVFRTNENGSFFNYCETAKNSKRKMVFFQEEFSKKNVKSRQPSFDESSSSLFITPSN